MGGPRDDSMTGIGTATEIMTETVTMIMTTTEIGTGTGTSRGWPKWGGGSTRNANRQAKLCERRIKFVFSGRSCGRAFQVNRRETVCQTVGIGRRTLFSYLTFGRY